MQELRYNNRPYFAEWIVRERLLTSPFVLVDAGVLGGESPRWHVFGDYLEVHGFDPLPDVISELTEKTKGDPRRHYSCLALGHEDAETTLYVNDANKTSTSVFPRGAHRLDTTRGAPREMRATMRRLDTLLAQGAVPPPDFIKIDVEAFEKFVLLGAERSLASCLGVEIETSFSVAANVYPRGHLATLQEILVGHHMRVFDIVFNRVPCEAFQQALERHGYPRIDDETIGRPATIDALFCRDPIEERERPVNYSPAPLPMTVDQIIKAMMVCEIYRLNDVALDAAVYFRELLTARLDVNVAVEHLVRSAGLPLPVPREAPAPVAPDPRRVSVRCALREGARDVTESLRHSIRHRLGHLRLRIP